MIDQLTELKDEKYIIYDRCPLDVLVYTVLAAEANQVSEEFWSRLFKGFEILLVY